MNQTMAKDAGKGSYLFGDDYQDATFDAPKQIDDEAIRREAHVVNGGEAEFKCPACKGRGDFYAYTGRYVGPCFKCKGKGNISKGQAAAAKAKVTKERNKLEWAQAHTEVVAYAKKRADKGSQFYAGLLVSLDAYGNWTERQVEIIRKDMAKDAEFYAKRDAERKAAAPVVPTEALEALFDQAKVKLAKTAIFRTVDITISKAKATSRNPGALYVKTTDGGQYCGKIVAGKFIKAYGAPDVTEALQAVAADPTAEAIKYGNKFKACCCCGTTLRNPVSVLAIVGPVCGPKWGLDHLRLAAAEMLADEAAAEEQERLR